MALNFPTSPTLNQTYTNGTTIWAWNGASWDVKSSPSTITDNSQLTNGAGFITSSALNGYALSSAVPTKTSDLTNDSGFITSSALSSYATQTYVNTAVADLATTSYVGTTVTNALSTSIGDINSALDAINGANI